MAVAKGEQWVLGARSETGYVRSANEDRMGFTRTPFGNVYVVSDGMGGYRGGALAAELTVNTLQQRLGALSPEPASYPDRVREAFAAANQAVFDRRHAGDPETRNMGATGVVLVTAGARALVGHVGDSRAYLMQHRGRRLQQLTRDHTRVQKLVDAGMLTLAQAADHPEASVLDRAIGHQPTVEVDVSGWIDLKPRDMILLCSDGLSGYVEDAQIEQVLRSRGSPQELADKLVDLALRKGGEDNVTVQLVCFGRGAAEPWWKQPAIVGPATMAASAAVAWSLASPHLEDAAMRIARLEKQLEETQRERSDLMTQVQTLNAELQRRAAAQDGAGAHSAAANTSGRAGSPSRGADARAAQHAPAATSPPPAQAEPSLAPAAGARTIPKLPTPPRTERKTASTVTPARAASGPARTSSAAKAALPASAVRTPVTPQAAAPAAAASSGPVPDAAQVLAPAPATQASTPATATQAPTVGSATQASTAASGALGSAPAASQNREVGPGP